MMENNILLNKEQEKNKIDKIVCETELNNTKNNFAKQILNGMGNEINYKTINPQPIKIKRNIFYYIKEFFKKIF